MRPFDVRLVCPQCHRTVPVTWDLVDAILHGTLQYCPHCKIEMEFRMRLSPPPPPRL